VKIRDYYTDLLDRAARTAAQTAAALVVGDGVGILDVDWAAIGSVAGLAAIASVLTTIGQRGLFNREG